MPVTVAQIPTRISVTPRNLALQAGEEQTLDAVVHDAEDLPIAGAPVTYASNAAGVATVSPTGLVHAVANGSAVITVASGALSVTVGVFVGTVPAGERLAQV